MTNKDLRDRVFDVLTTKRAEMPMEWIVHQILQGFAPPQGPDSDLDELCRYSHVRVVVREVLRGLKQDDESEDSEQLILPGFKRLQQRYIIERDGEMVAMRTELLDRDQLSALARERRVMAQGNVEHAEELERYRDDKFGDPAAAVA